MKKCTNCRVGLESVVSDSETIVCPYIDGCIKNKFCYYKPIKNRKNILSLIMVFLKKLILGL